MKNCTFGLLIALTIACFALTTAVWCPSNQVYIQQINQCAARVPLGFVCAYNEQCPPRATCKAFMSGSRMCQT
uniref:EB domain-containing protein n=1 Tax=Romanomermis culicivorax TaxID=13658 RepID=A0A915J019_ROMCU